MASSNAGACGLITFKRCRAGGAAWKALRPYQDLLHCECRSIVIWRRWRMLMFFEWPRPEIWFLWCLLPIMAAQGASEPPEAAVWLLSQGALLPMWLAPAGVSQIAGQLLGLGLALQLSQAVCLRISACICIPRPLCTCYQAHPTSTAPGGHSLRRSFSCRAARSLRSLSMPPPMVMVAPCPPTSPVCRVRVGRHAWRLGRWHLVRVPHPYRAGSAGCVAHRLAPAAGGEWPCLPAPGIFKAQLLLPHLPLRHSSVGRHCRQALGKHLLPQLPALGTQLRRGWMQRATSCPVCEC